MTAGFGLPQRIGGFGIERQLGRGGMGVVYLATQTELNRQVALKVLAAELADDPEFVARFHREATALASLDSPHVVAMYDHGSADGFLYLVTQYVSGGDLGAYLRARGALPAATALSVFGQILEGLGDAHARGVIHRDIKPSNVLVRGDRAEPYVYLADFGIAQTDGDSGRTSTGLVVGSVAYLAPERQLGAPATVQSDIYAAGCVLWEMLTGGPPYPGTFLQQAQAHAGGPLPQLAGSDPVTVQLNQLISWCLAKDPGNRPGSAAELLAVTRRIDGEADDRTRLRAAVGGGVAGQPGQLSPAVPPTRRSAADATVLRAAATPAPPRPPASPPRRRGLLIGGSVAVTAAVAAGLVWVLPQLGAGAGESAAAGTVPSLPASNSAVPSRTVGEAEPVRYTCWDGSTADELSECGDPEGEPGDRPAQPSAAMAYLYPSLAEGFASGGCAPGDPPSRPQEVWVCKASGTLVRYVFWASADDAREHFPDKFRPGGSHGRSEPYDLYLGDELAGYAWESLERSESTGRYVISATWLDWRYSVTVESTRRDELLDLFGQLRFRELSQVTGHPATEAPAEVTGTLSRR